MTVFTTCPMCAGTGKSPILDENRRVVAEMNCVACEGRKVIEDRTQNPQRCEECGNQFMPYQTEAMKADLGAAWWQFELCPVCEEKHQQTVREKRERGESTWVFDVGGPDDVPDSLLEELPEQQQHEMLGRNRAERRKAEREARRKR